MIFFEHQKFIENLKEAIWKENFCDIDRIEICLEKPYGLLEGLFFQ